MKVIIIDEKSKNKRLNKIIDWLVHILGYTLVLITVSILFKSVNIDNSYFGFFALLASLIIYVLNKTIKPIIFLLTLPITAITLGIFYPFINVLILKIVDFLLGSKFETGNIFSLFFIAILIAILNIIMEEIIIKPIIKRGEKDGPNSN